MRRIIIPICLLLIGITVFGNDDPEWKEFTSRTGGFSVQMPGTATELSPKELGFDEGAPVHGYIVNGENVKCIVFTVEIFTYPSSSSGENLVDSYIGNLASGGRGESPKKRSMMIGRYIGKEFQLDSDDSILLGRTFLVKRTVISLIAIEPKSKTIAGQATRFLQSFRLKDSPDLQAEYKEFPKIVRRPLPKVKKTENELRNQAIELITPEYPDHARPRNLVDDVIVEVVIDEHGFVEDATGIKGDAIFYNPAVVAARASSFKPFMLNGKPIRVLSWITYHFSPDK